ncbi:hypothetical protein Tco_0326216, partial [Tanacetum coccineum]
LMKLILLMELVLLTLKLALLALKFNGSNTAGYDKSKVDMTNQRWSVSTVTRWDTLQGNAEDLGTKIAGTGIKTALKGL